MDISFRHIAATEAPFTLDNDVLSHTLTKRPRKTKSITKGDSPERLLSMRIEVSGYQKQFASQRDDESENSAGIIIGNAMGIPSCIRENVSNVYLYTLDRTYHAKVSSMWFLSINALLNKDADLKAALTNFPIDHKSSTKIRPVSR